MILPATAFPLLSHSRVSQITFHPTQPYLAIQSQERSVEIFRIRTEEEVRKKQARRKKRAKEKREREEHAVDETNENGTVEEEISLVDLFTPHVIVRAGGKIRSFSFDSQEVSVKGGAQVCVSVCSIALFDLLLTDSTSVV
jgi:U3 small nucleolar RNA-associated protein 12